jgi:signal transduction histidine kinase
MASFTGFTLGDMTRLGAHLRCMGESAISIEEVARRVVESIRTDFVDPKTGHFECPLVRFFKTERFDALDSDLQGFAVRMLRDGHGVRPDMKCLRLVATVGEKAEWNHPSLSVSHRAIPLASRQLIEGAPMIARLLEQLGVRVEALLAREPELVDPPGSAFNVFFVPEASGSGCIPDQAHFVEPFGIASVLGFGGALPDGEIFVVILFSNVPITREVASLFRTLALNLEVAVLEIGSAGNASAQIAALEQLLEVYERTVVEQSALLYEEKEHLRMQTHLLRSQGEASLVGILSVSQDGTILYRNRRFSEIWRIDSSGVLVERYDDLLRRMAMRAGEPLGIFEDRAAVDEWEERRDEVELADGRALERYTAPVVDEAAGMLLGRLWQFRDVSEGRRDQRLEDDLIASASREGGLAVASIEGTLRLQPLRLESLMQRAIEAMRPHARELGVAFQLQCSTAQALVCVDPDGIMQVMENLLSNAAKHSPPRATVHVDVHREGHTLRVAVKDRGCGIPKEIQRGIFERSGQLQSAAAARRAGKGIGLSVVRAIIEYHRGTIDFQSEPGEGTTFFFRLPELRVTGEAETR